MVFSGKSCGTLCLWLALLSIIAHQASASYESVPTPDNEMKLIEGPGLSNEFAISLEVSPDDKLVVLSRGDKTDNSSYFPVARSYNAGDWERSAGPPSNADLTITCENVTTTRKCTVSGFPQAFASDKFFLTSYSHSLSDRERAARFLEMVTFGPTRSAINLLTQNNDTSMSMESKFAQFVKNQIDMPYVSHREYFRKHLNQRMMETFNIAVSGPGPCHRHSRWRRFAFTEKDKIIGSAKNIKLQIISLTNPDNNKTVYALHFDGQLRTVVDEPIRYFTNFRKNNLTSTLVLENAESEFQICHVESIEGSRRPPLGKYSDTAFSTDEKKFGRISPSSFSLKIGNYCKEIVGGNPSVNLDFDEYINRTELRILDLSTLNMNEHLSEINTQYSFGSMLLLNVDIDNNMCEYLNEEHNPLDQLSKKGAWKNTPFPPLFARLPNNEGWAIYDQRIDLKENTVENPLIDGGGTNVKRSISPKGSVSATICITNPPTIFNMESCRLSTEENACKSKYNNQYVALVLTDENLQYLNNVTTDSHLYTKRDLPFDNEEPTPVCKLRSRSRWVPIAGVPTEPLCRSASNISISDETHASVASALYDGRDENIYLKDILFKGACDSSDSKKVGFAVFVAETGVCYKNVHPDELSVHDEKKSQYIGRYGDSKSYDDLPSHLKKYSVSTLPYTQDFRAKQGGTVVCGSPKEVASDPTLDDHFEIRGGSLEEGYGAKQTQTVWTMKAIYSEDQLRQRMAFALSQIFVVDPNIITGQNYISEPEIFFYDIFIRNGLGNYFDVMREVSFSSRMAEMLTFIRNKAVQIGWHNNRKLNFPDENYARELMQLFTIGLVELNLDGSAKRDDMGVAIKTYNSHDIVSFARAWTGFDYYTRRGNYEDIPWPSRWDRMSPMKITDVKWRDWFPKRGLSGKYIGDHKPLCADLPDKHFLKIGAKYRLLGGSSRPLWHNNMRANWDDIGAKRFVLNPATSSLYQKLCAADNDGACTFPGIVTLDTNIECDGVECSIDTAHQVQVAPGVHVYYEYLRLPCVNLEVFESPKKIVSFRWQRTASMCGNPRTTSATEACCGLHATTKYNRRSNVDIADRACEYLGEFVTYNTNTERCIELGGFPCDIATLEPAYGNQDCNGHHWGTHDFHSMNIWHWTTAPCSIKLAVQDNGLVALVHDADNTIKYFDTVKWLNQSTTASWFSIYWEQNDFGDDEYPSPSNSCGDGACIRFDEYTCLCDTTLIETAAFSDMPTRDQVLQLSVGAFPPEMFDDGTYSQIATTSGVEVYRRNVPIQPIKEAPPRPPPCTGNWISFNAGAENGNRGGWDQQRNNLPGGVNVIGITSPGYGGSQYAIKATNRVNDRNGVFPATDMFPKDCAKPNVTINIQFKVKAFNDTDETPYACTSVGNCIQLRIYPVDNIGLYGQWFKTDGDMYDNWNATDWNTFSLNFTIPERWAGIKSRVQLHVIGPPPGIGYFVDDFSVVQIYPDNSWSPPESTEETVQLGNYSAETIFKVLSDDGKPVYRKNLQSRVLIGNEGQYNVRNIPNIFNLADPNLRDAHYETDSVLDHLLHHYNTAPFVSKNLIQHFGISNPSPDYIMRVATVFRRGYFEYSDGQNTLSYGEGNTGDLAATAAAIVLDQEATSVVLDADPTHGALKEPLVKVIGFMRSMEYTRNSYSKHSWTMLSGGLKKKIGQMVFEAPSVFSFFSPLYSPPGRLSQASLSSPESQILSTVTTVGMTNGLFSLIHRGLTGCGSGFGSYSNDWCDYVHGYLAYSPESDPSNATQVVNDLATLVTGGRLSQRNRHLIETEYSNVYNETDGETALRVAQQLIATSPEFHTTSLIRQTDEDRNPSELSGTTDEPYKAIVYIYGFGGLDSFYMLAPYHDDLSCEELYNEYKKLREGAALPDNRMRRLNASSSDQPCNEFGLHDSLSVVGEKYDKGEALFFANTGYLSKPVSKFNWITETRAQLFSHFHMMKEAEYVDAFREKAGTGVLGRMLDILQLKNYRVTANSIDKHAEMLNGDHNIPRGVDVIGRDGLEDFYPERTSSTHDKETMISSFNKLNGAMRSNTGIYGDYWSQNFVDGINRTADIRAAYGSVQLSSSYSGSTGNRLQMVSKLIKARVQREVNRDAFHVSLGGFDTHSNMAESVNSLLSDLNSGLVQFVAEMESSGLWNNVLIVFSSEFGRTIKPNTGGGTDHAWGGNYFMLGGAVKGGQILGKYPDMFAESDATLDGRGRLLPTTSWDALWNGIAQWFGITEEDDLDYVLPNRQNFGCRLLTDKDMFAQGIQETPGCNGEKIVFEQKLLLAEARYLTPEEQHEYCKILVKFIEERATKSKIQCTVLDQKIIIEPKIRRRLSGETFLTVSTEIYYGNSTDITNSTNSTELEDDVEQLVKSSGPDLQRLITSNESSIALNVTNITETVLATDAPTQSPTQPPTASPAPSSAVISPSFDFDIHAGEIDVKFDANRASEEIIFNYNISSKPYGVTLYGYDCKVEVEEDVLSHSSDETAGTPSPFYKNLAVKVNVHEDTIQNVSNNVWVDGEPGFGKIRFCVRLDLMAGMGNNTASANFHEYAVAIEVDMRQGFVVTDIATNREDSTLEDKNVTIDLEINAYRCDENNNAISDNPLSQGSALRVCLATNKADYILKEVLDFQLNQEGAYGGSTTPIDNGEVNDLSESSCSGQTCFIKTMMLSSFFDVRNVDNTNVTGSGKVLFDFSTGSARRNLATNANLIISNTFDARNLQGGQQKYDESSSEFRLTLQVQMPPTKQSVPTDSAQPTSDNGGETVFKVSGLVFIVVGIIGVLAFWFVVWRKKIKRNDKEMGDAWEDDANFVEQKAMILT